MQGQITLNQLKSVFWSCEPEGSCEPEVETHQQPSTVVRAGNREGLHYTPAHLHARAHVGTTIA